MVRLNHSSRKEKDFVLQDLLHAIDNNNLQDSLEIFSVLQSVVHHYDIEIITRLFSKFLSQQSNSRDLPQKNRISSRNLSQLRYTDDYYKAQQDGSYRSAREVVPILLELFNPKRVVDVGCGVGTWLSVFMEYGISDVLGIDGDWVNQEQLRIPDECFFSFNLEKSLAVNRDFDLVLSLEVAEHLPVECADMFVNSLCRLGSIICFSAAIPFQGGNGHINEQWPSYWVKKFQNNGFETVDCLRERIWNNDNVKFYYAQNMFIFAKRDDIEANPLIKEAFEKTKTANLARIHPKLYLRQVLWDTRFWPFPFLLKFIRAHFLGRGGNQREQIIKTGINPGQP